jgi:long-chain acyl-CoA synthetase
LKEGQELDHRELIAFVSQHIASYKKPQYVEFVSEFPLLKDGSPDRDQIKELYGGPQE